MRSDGVASLAFWVQMHYDASRTEKKYTIFGLMADCSEFFKSFKTVKFQSHKC